MNVVKTKAGEELDRLAACAAAPAPLFTDWIPCTTPPVRVGVYECSDQHGHTWRAEYRHGQWIHNDGQRMDHTMQRPDLYSWRGVRRWVITVQCFLYNSVRPYVAHVSRRGAVYMTDKLLKPTSSSYAYTAALTFETEGEAVAYATKHARHLSGWKAELA